MEVIAPLLRAWAQRTTLVMIVKLLDKSGTIIVEDEKGFHWEDDVENGGEIVQISKLLKPKEFF